MKNIKFIVFWLVVAVALFTLIGCEDFLNKFPNIVTVEFDPNGGTWVSGHEGNEIREGKEGDHFNLPKVEYVLEKTDRGEGTFFIRYKEFLGWNLKDTNTLVYNAYDEKGAYPQENRVYAAKWGDEETKIE